MSDGVDKLSHSKRCETTGKRSTTRLLPPILLVGLTMLALIIAEASCGYYSSGSAFQAPSVQEVLAARMNKLEQNKFVPPSPLPPLMIDSHSLAYETYRIGREGRGKIDVQINIDAGGFGGMGGGDGIGGGGGGGGGGG